MSPQGTPVTPKLTEAEKLDLRNEWYVAKKALDEVRAREVELRKQVFAADFPEPELGTQRIELGAGYKLKAVYSLSYKLIGGNDMVETIQNTVAGLSATGSVLADRLIKWTPELSTSEYKKLDPDVPEQLAIKQLIDKIIETKPATPTLEVEAPKV